VFNFLITRWLAKRRMGGLNPFYSPSRDMRIIEEHFGKVMEAAMLRDSERLQKLENDTEYSKAVKRVPLTAVEPMPDLPPWANYPYFPFEDDEELDGQDE
jgi:hypothetical protein